MTVELVPVTPDIREACSESPKNLEVLLGLNVPEHWPEFPEAFDASFPFNKEWPSFLFVDRTINSVVGNGGYVGPPDTSGEVEIGFEVAPVFRNSGYATGAVHLLLKRAFQYPAVKSVVAYTLPEKNASNSVLSKSKFVFDKVVDHGADGSVWRWVCRTRT
ncbi:MAG: GNAT family N-acetyltransferase [Nitrospiraceae bacterium]